MALFSFKKNAILTARFIASVVFIAAFLFVNAETRADETDAARPESQVAPASQAEVEALKELSYFFTKELSEKLRQAVWDGTIDPNEFEKLEFDQPGDPGFGDNPDYEVFNRWGKRFVMGRWFGRRFFTQDQIDAITTEKNVRPFYRIIRSLQGGIVAQLLVVVIPKTTEYACKRFTHMDSNRDVNVFESSYEDLYSTSYIPTMGTGCFEFYGVYYIVEPLAARIKRNIEDKSFRSPGKPPPREKGWPTF